VDQPPGAAKRVLIAEDDDHMRDVLQDLLSGAGYSVIAAEDGLEALDWLSRLSVSLLMVDILMPGLDGPQLIKRLRQTTQWAKVPILVLSGYADLARYRDLPVDGVQLKPFRVADFLTKVEQLIGPASG